MGVKVDMGTGRGGLGIKVEMGTGGGLGFSP